MDRFTSKVRAKSVSEHDVCVIGGGLSGTLMASALQKAGMRTCLVQRGQWNDGQSGVCQGFIHSGLKYLDIPINSPLKIELAQSREIWHRYLSAGRPGFSQHPVHYLFSSQSAWLYRFRNLAHCHGVSADETAQFCRHWGFRGQAFRTTEIAVNTIEVMTHERQLLDCALLARSWNLSMADETVDSQYCISSNDGNLLKARAVVIASAEGMPELAAQTPMGNIPIKRRPLWLATLNDMPTAAAFHFYADEPRPMITVSSRPGHSGNWVWQIGGDIGDGALSEVQFEERIRSLFSHLFPNLVIGALSPKAIDRIEPQDGSSDVSITAQIVFGRNAVALLPNKATSIPAMVERALLHLCNTLRR
jgi:glycine/D-amino acid oxidase-like deaminating enzyme